MMSWSGGMGATGWAVMAILYASLIAAVVQAAARSCRNGQCEAARL
jgi:hypothetical protein